MTIEHLTIQSCQILLGLCGDMRAIADDRAQSQASRAFWTLRAETLQAWIDAVGETLRVGATPAMTRPAIDEPLRSFDDAPPREHDWIAVIGAIAAPGQPAFKFSVGPLAGIPLSIGFHGPGVVVWLARNTAGEMFVRPWEAKDTMDVPDGAFVIGSYRPALLAGPPGGFEWLPVPHQN